MGNVCTLYYNVDHNLMMDEDGFIVFDIYNYVPPHIYFLFLKKKEYMCVETSKDCFVELVCPGEDYDDEPPFY